MIVGILKPEAKTIFTKLFPDGKVPLKSPVPYIELYNFSDEYQHSVIFYKADFKQFTEEQKIIICQVMGVAFGHLPSKIFEHIKRIGFTVPLAKYYVDRVDFER